MDGLKTSQRKILFGCLKRNLTSKVKVAQLAGYISEHSGYHHGEMSLNETIVGMAQNFVGSNNLPWLVPQGQFGTRLEGGDDSAATRYIFTYMQPYIKHLIPSDDLPVLKYRDDDGLSVEPDWYAPILPMLLINGCSGIGTGYSTFIPSYNPTEIRELILKWLTSGCTDDILMKACIVPWFRGFKGTISEEDGGYAVRGQFTYNPKTKTLIVTDLPIGVWTSKFKHMLDAYCEKKEIVKDYTDTSTDVDIHFEIVLYEDLPIAKIEKELGLVKKIKTTNMHAFDAAGHIRKYDNVNEILIEYCRARLSLYGVRKENMLKELRDKLPWHTSVVKFLTLMCNDVIDLRKKPLPVCREILLSHGLECIDELLTLPFSSITEEKIQKHQDELNRLQKRITQIEKTFPPEFWMEDLGYLKV
jgi:DNA topoisomerase-2